MTAELWPYARTGGLGQAVADLAGYQSRNGLSPIVVLPLYRAARETAGPLQLACEPFVVHQDGAENEVRCYETRQRKAGPWVLFLDHPPSFDRAGLYGESGCDYEDNAQRFALLALGALEIARRLIGKQLVIHAHDWHTALTPVYMHAGCEGHPPFPRVPSILSVHNAGFQGVFDASRMRTLGLPSYLWSPRYMEWYGRVNFLKGALKFADVVTTVSATHATEIRTELGGFGLHEDFKALGTRLVGIRNGIDEERWDPRCDTDIPSRFHAIDLRGKAACKLALQQTIGLPARADVPLFAMSARLVAQKGIELVLKSKALRRTSAQFVFLGEGEARFETALRELAAELPDRIAAVTTFADKLEHLLLAGADFLLMPSLYEPCGLTQMRAQRYGTLPVVRRTGGLADTVDDTIGFVFDEFSAAAFDKVLERAVQVYGDALEHRRRVREAMRCDFSWAEPNAAYVDAYRQALATTG